MNIDFPFATERQPDERIEINGYCDELASSLAKELGFEIYKRGSPQWSSKILFLAAGRESTIAPNPTRHNQEPV